MKKFTFKIHKPTGRYRSFDTEYADIKLNKQVVGSINEASALSCTSYEERYSISLMIENDPGNNCSFKWVRLKKKFSSMDDAKAFVNENAEALQTVYKLMPLKD